MTGFTLAIVLAMLPAAGNFIGGLLAELVRVSDRTLSLALHSAAGVIFAVVGIELVPEAFEAGPPWVMVVALFLGGGFAILADALLGVVRTRTGGISDEGAATSWAIYFGVSVDLFSDGIIIGTGSLIDPSLGLLLALGQVPADIPEGFATIATFKRLGMSRTRRLLLSLAFAAPILVGSTIGYWLLRGQVPAIQYGLLAFVAGILLTVAVEEIIVQAHDADQDSRWASLFTIGGFALFAVLASYLG